MTHPTRRCFLVAAGMAPFALAATAKADPAICYDPAALPLSQRSRRRSLGYVDVSTDSARRCGHCAFFTGSAAQCGTCAMLSGGTVNAGGFCNSFAVKSAN